MVKVFLISVLSFSVYGTFAQNGTPENNSNLPVTNSNTFQFNTNGTVTNESESNEIIEQADTVQVQQDALKDKSTKPTKTVTTRSATTPPARKREESPIMQGIEVAPEFDAEPTLAAPSPIIEGINAANQSANYSFEISKKQATEQRQQRSPSYQQQVAMDQAVGYFESSAPNSFEFHYFKYVSGNYDVDLIDHLRQAATLRPDNADVHVQMAAYHIIKQNKDSATLFLNKLTTSGRLTTNTLHYAEDILISAPKDGTLITHGFDDTYGVWKKQQVDGVRKDVTIVSLDFLQSSHYRTWLTSKGYVLPQSTIIDVAYLTSFCELNEQKKLGISLTTPKEYFTPIQSKLYVTGLVFEYHKSEFANFKRNDELWNENLKKYVVNNATDEKSKQLSANYLPMLLQLRKVYQQQEDAVKLKEIDAATDKVSVQCKKYEQVQKLKNSY